MVFYSSRLPRFQYLSPATLEEACQLLAQHRDRAAILGGGTDLFPDMRRRVRAPEYIVSLRRIPGLDQIQENDGTVTLGARVTLSQVRASPLVQGAFPVLAEAAARFANPQVRNVATLGGNLSTASCCADTASPLIVLDAQVTLLSSRGARTVPIEGYFQAPFKPARAPDEVLVGTSIPLPAPDVVSTYLKYTLPGATGYAFVGAAAWLHLDGDRCREARLALVASSQCWLREGCLYECPFPFRAREAEAALNGKRWENKAIGEAARIASHTAHPMVNTDYTRQMIEVFTRRALLRAGEKARAASPS